MQAVRAPVRRLLHLTQKDPPSMNDDNAPVPVASLPEPAVQDDPDLARLIDLVERMGPADEA